MENKRGSWAALSGVLVVLVLLARFVWVGHKVQQAVNDAPVLTRPVFNPHAGRPPLEQSIRQLNDPVPEARKVAARLIQGEAREPIGGLRPVPLAALKGLLEAAQDSDNDVRTSATLCLGKIGSEAIPPLLAALRKQQSRAVLWPCAMFGLAPLARVAVVVGEDPLLTRRHDACSSFGMALGRVGEPAFPHLLAGLRDPNNSVRLGAVMGLVVLGPVARPTIPTLLEMFGDSDPQVQTAAAMALARIGQPAVPGLAEKLKDNNASVRSLAANALGHVGPSRSRKELVGVLNDVEREGVQRRLQEERAAAKAKAVPALVEVLNDSSTEVRLYAATALLDFPDEHPAVTTALEELCKSSNRDVSRRAKDLLRRLRAGLGEPPAVDE